MQKDLTAWNHVEHLDGSCSTMYFNKAKMHASQHC